MPGASSQYLWAWKDTRTMPDGDVAQEKEPLIVTKVSILDGPMVEIKFKLDLNKGGMWSFLPTWLLGDDIRQDSDL